MTKWPDWEEAGKLENGEWRLEPDGEAEVPEIIIVSDAVEVTPVDVEGESRHEQVEASSRTAKAFRMILDTRICTSRTTRRVVVDLKHLVFTATNFYK